MQFTSCIHEVTSKLVRNSHIAIGTTFQSSHKIHSIGKASCHIYIAIDYNVLPLWFYYTNFASKILEYMDMKREKLGFTNVEYTY